MNPGGPIQIAHIIYHLGIGGGELFLRDLVTHTARRRFTHRVFCIGATVSLAGGLEASGVPVRSFGKRTRLGLGTVLQLASVLRRERPHVVHTHGEAGIFWGIPAAVLARVPSVALVYQNYPESRGKMAAMQWLLPASGRVVAGSNDVRRFMVERIGLREQQVLTVPCGIDTRAFVAASHRLPRDAPIVVTVGRLVARKGHATLVTAFRTVADVLPAAELRIIGEGPLRAGLVRQIRDLGLQDRVQLPGTIWPSEPALRQARVFVFPSLVEPQGLALLEAFAAGVPVVASRTGGIPEMLAHERDGLLVPPGDPDALAHGIIRLLDDEPLRQRCIRQARERVRDFDIRVIARRYEAIYEALRNRPEPCIAHEPRCLDARES